jgi:hypothetical protein
MKIRPVISELLHEDINVDNTIIGNDFTRVTKGITHAIMVKKATMVSRVYVVTI